MSTHDPSLTYDPFTVSLFAELGKLSHLEVSFDYVDEGDRRYYVMAGVHGQHATILDFGQSLRDVNMARLTILSGWAEEAEANDQDDYDQRYGAVPLFV